MEGKRTFTAIRAEFDLTRAALSFITGDDKRLAAEPPLARAIEHRFPAVERVQRGIHL